MVHYESWGYACGTWVQIIGGRSSDHSSVLTVAQAAVVSGSFETVTFECYRDNVFRAGKVVRRPTV